MKRRGREQAPGAGAKLAVIYTRKAMTAGLDHELPSFDAQRESCEAYVRRKPGWVLLEAAYDNGRLADAHTEDPAFQRLRADVEAGLIEVVVR